MVVGTHRLLSKDVRFRDLGLLIVDEEQRFGVAAKERLKQLRTEVDVLTLSATPIPRTLNLALVGVRDLSVIETPPEDRLPIQTRVAEASAGLVKDAILRELDRGGQVFFVHNRVETIEAQADQLRRLLPSARVVVGHGQMTEGALERVMRTFAGGDADVLVCTTIIESGLDIPNANTIIIDRADALGLAQLYQLRGRVGRSNRRAYAYLLYRRRDRLSDEARKRLQAIFNASELGAGFQIALADLEIRGAGNILGGEQSGHMADVGFDLYTRLLAEAVEERKASHEGREPVRASTGSTVDLPVDAHLPETYVPDEAQKLELYRRLARARTPGDLAAFRQEVTDRFGPMPPPVLRLVEVAELRLAAEAAGIASLAREEGQLVVRFGSGLTRGEAMRLVAGAPLPGVRPGDVTFAREPGPDPRAPRPGPRLDADPGPRRPGRGGARGVRAAGLTARTGDPSGSGVVAVPVRGEAIAQAVLGLDEAPPGRRRRQPCPQVPDRHPQQVVIVPVAAAPDGHEELGVGHEDTGSLGEVAQQPVLRRREVDRRPRDLDAVAGAVDPHPEQLDRCGLARRGRQPAGAAQRGGDARHELREAQGLRHVVVRAGAEPADLVGLRAARGHDDDRHPAVLADPLDDVPAVDAREADVEHDEVGRILLERPERVGAVGRDAGLPPVALQPQR